METTQTFSPEWGPGLIVVRLRSVVDSYDMIHHGCLGPQRSQWEAYQSGALFKTRLFRFADRLATLFPRL